MYIFYSIGRLSQHLKEGNLNLATSLSMLIIDEADLIFSFGFEADLRHILTQLPPIYQVPPSSKTWRDGSDLTFDFHYIGSADVRHLVRGRDQVEEVGPEQSCCPEAFRAAVA